MCSETGAIALLGGGAKSKEGGLNVINPLVLLAKRKQSQLIQVSIVGALLCALPVAGFLMSRMTQSRYSLLALVVLIVPFGLLALVERLELGLTAMLLAGVFVRFRIPTGTFSEIVISLVICGGCIALWLVRMLVVDKRTVLKPAPINLPLLSFIATVVISWVWSRAFRDLLVHEAGHPLVSVAAGLVMILLPACSLLVSNNVRNVRWLQALVWVLLGEGLIILIIDPGYSWGAGPLQAVGSFLRTNGVIHVNSQGLLSMWCIAFALALALFNRRLHWIARVLLFAYAGAWVYWGFYLRIAWLAGWAPAFVAAAVVAFFRSKWLFVVVIVALVIGAGRYYYETGFQAEANVSGVTRLEAYRVNWRITGKHLLFGTGPAGYASYYVSYFPDEAMASHSNYIDIIAQTGIVGSFFLLWFFGAQAWGAYKLRLKLQGRADFAESLAVAILAGTTGCVVAMALGDWLLPFAYTQGIIGFDLALFNWFFMGSLWALTHILGARADTGR
jgi:O-antigen ligase